MASLEINEAKLNYYCLEQIIATYNRYFQRMLGSVPMDRKNLFCPVANVAI